MTATIGFCFALLAIIWAWINFNWFAEAFDTDDWMFRVLTMVQMSGVIVLAIGLSAMFKSTDVGAEFDNRVMAVGCVIMRVALAIQWLRAAASDPKYRTVALTYAAFVGAAQLGWVAVATAPLPFGWALAAGAALLILEMVGPGAAETKGAKHGGGSTPWNAHHITERYSLLAIIALGETMLGTLASASAISSAEGWTLDAIVVCGTGIAPSFSMGWASFLVPHAPVLAAHRSKAFPWGYGHVAFYGGIAATGAGRHRLHRPPRAHLRCGPVSHQLLARFTIHRERAAATGDALASAHLHRRPPDRRPAVGVPPHRAAIPSTHHRFL